MHDQSHLEVKAMPDLQHFQEAFACVSYRTLQLLHLLHLLHSDLY
jgi:hypothetical protein